MRQPKEPTQGNCIFCGRWGRVADGDMDVTWCEDGAPIHCQQHFDDGGYHVVCEDRAACDGRRSERQAALATEKDRRHRETADRRQRAETEIARAKDQLAAMIAGRVESQWGPEFVPGTGSWDKKLPSGRTITLCRWALQFSDGRVEQLGAPDLVVAHDVVSALDPDANLASMRECWRYSDGIVVRHKSGTETRYYVSAETAEQYRAASLARRRQQAEIAGWPPLESIS